MAKVFIEESTLTAIGDAIRGKTGKTELIDPANMSTEIASIEAGGGGGRYEPPEEAFLITGDCTYMNNNGKWDWFFRDFGDRIATSGLTTCTGMFYGTTLEEIPFQLNITSIPKLTNLFHAAKNLKVCPRIRGSIDCNNGTTDLNVLNQNFLLRDVEDLFTPEMLEGFSQFKITSSYTLPKPTRMSSMYSLRKVPSWWYCFTINPESTAAPSASSTIYYQAFQTNYALDEVRNIPVIECQAAITSNMFGSTFNSCQRLQAATFETNEDGTPKTAKWKTQTIDLSSNVGWQATSGASAGPVAHNSGITLDKKVISAETYSALKNDPDWYACALEYSRYNYDSAVETINSLPDTSEYLTSVGGTNTIKFKKNSGLYTDGGGITNETMVEASAIAAAKGWTVAIS